MTNRVEWSDVLFLRPDLVGPGGNESRINSRLSKQTLEG